MGVCYIYLTVLVTQLSSEDRIVQPITDNIIWRDSISVVTIMSGSSQLLLYLEDFIYQSVLSITRTDDTAIHQSDRN